MLPDFDFDPADPGFIAASADMLRDVEDVVRGLLAQQDWKLHARRYGIDGVTDWADMPDSLPREVFLLCECVAPDADTANWSWPPYVSNCCISVLRVVGRQEATLPFRSRLPHSMRVVPMPFPSTTFLKSTAGAR